jgi:putative ABC transport system substrate-binding protein
MKQFSILLICSLLFIAACGTKKDDASGSGGDGGDKVYKIGITQIASHPALDAAREGFLAALKDNGFEEGKNLEVDEQNAQGDPNNAASIAQKFASDKLDLVLAIATPTAQAAAQNIKDIPVLFTAVSDPLGAKLVESLEKPGGNLTGTADMHPEALVKNAEFIASDFPNVKKIGTISNQGEDNSVIMVRKAEEEFAKHNIEMVKVAVSNTSEVKQAAESLVGKIDAFYITLDNTVVDALESVVQVAEENKIPLFVSDKDSLSKGAFATYGFDYYDLGYDTGKMAVEILKNGANPADMPVRYAEKLDLVLNMEAAKKQGIEVTEEMKAKVQDKKNILNDSES